MEAIRRCVQGLSPKAEFAIVTIGAFGFSILASLLAAVFPKPTPPISENALELLLKYESIILLILGAFLYLRGWTLRRLGIRITAKDSLIGVGLAAAVYGAFLSMWWVAVYMGIRPSFAGSYQEVAAHGLNWLTVVATSILNPFYEEIFLCGYIVTVAKTSSRVTAGINLSVAIRLMCHLYQGSIGVLEIIPMGLVFTLWYARTGRLWPVLVAHALFDATGLLHFLA